VTTLLELVKKEELELFASPSADPPLKLDSSMVSARWQ
jgi:hypothetical protein